MTAPVCGNCHHYRPPRDERAARAGLKGCPHVPDWLYPSPASACRALPARWAERHGVGGAHPTPIARHTPA